MSADSRERYFFFFAAGLAFDREAALAGLLTFFCAGFADFADLAGLAGLADLDDFNTATGFLAAGAAFFGAA